MKHVIISFFIASISLTLMAQVGIGTTDPNPNSALDVYSKKKGLLIPRITDVGGVDKTEGSLIYDSLNGAFLYCHKNKWHDLTSFISEESGTNTTLRSKYKNLKLPGDIEADGSCTANNFVGLGTVPLGGIMMWSGNPSYLPNGFALCDGTGSYKDEWGNTLTVPNLSGRFIVGYDKSDTDYNNTRITGPSYTDADGTYDGSSTKDAKQIRLKSNQSGVPAHKHRVQGSTSTSGNHNHKARNGYGTTENGKKDNRYPAGRGGGIDQGMNDLITKGDGAHSHSINFFSQNNTTANAAVSHENRPPFYVLAYIIRVK
ncbi:MAG: phage tail protein [Bacteroidales bacterium]|nr:phage tail protein [Bacteroidales bacterium]